MLRRVLGEQVTLEISPDPALWPVRADPGQLEQVIVNLAANARDAMPEGGHFTLSTVNTIFHGTEAQAPPGIRPGPYAMLSASDTGCGMPPETLARVFEPFFTTKEVGQGTGLGLAMVYGIIQQSGGFITAASEVGRGTTFRTYLPAVREVVSSPEQTSTELGDWPRGRETLLLAEDEEAVRTLASHVLERCGYRVLTARDGEEALHLADSYLGSIDLLVSDVVMPSLGGQELARQLIARRPALRVIYISGYATRAALPHGLAQGTTCLLSKPFGPLTLARLVRAVLDGKQ
jgi:CheY-like chemotaxis protein